MLSKYSFAIVVSVLCAVAVCDSSISEPVAVSTAIPEETAVHHAVMYILKGCPAKRFPEVTKFASLFSLQFSKLLLKYHSEDPQLQFFDANDVQIGDAILLPRERTADEIKQLLTSRGILMDITAPTGTTTTQPTGTTPASPVSEEVPLETHQSHDEL